MLMHLLEHPRTTVTNHHCTSSTSSALHFKTTPSILLTIIFLRLYASIFHYETETVLTGIKYFCFSSGKTSKLLSECHFCAIAVKDVLLWGCFSFVYLFIFFFSQSSASTWVSSLWHTWLKRKALPSSPHLREHSDLRTHPMYVLLEHIRSAPHSSYISLL